MKQQATSSNQTPTQSKSLPEARIEQVAYALAFCPACDAEHEVSTCGDGEEECVCGTRFYWSTVS